MSTDYTVLTMAELMAIMDDPTRPMVERRGAAAEWKQRKFPSRNGKR